MPYPFGRWVLIERFPEEPVIAFVYLDPHAGASAKGGLASDLQLADMPSRTIRLDPAMPLHPLTEAEAHARGLPVQPAWLAHYGKQPNPDAPWHRDPLLVGKFNAAFPDDIQAFVHDGDPRRVRRGPELCWVRMSRAEPRATAPLAPDGPSTRSMVVYTAELLNQPHTLTSVKRGDLIKLVSVHGLPHPLHVTADYLSERERWQITPCDRCGASECIDPPSVMAQVRFPDAPAGSEISAFTSFCSFCGGGQRLERIDALPVSPTDN